MPKETIDQEELLLARNSYKTIDNLITFLFNEGRLSKQNFEVAQGSLSTLFDLLEDLIDE